MAPPHGISCDDVKSRLGAYHEGDLPEAESAEIDSHLFACRRCRAQCDALDAIDRHFHSSPVPDPSREFIDRTVRAMVVAAAGPGTHDIAMSTADRQNRNSWPMGPAVRRGRSLAHMAFPWLALGAAAAMCAVAVLFATPASTRFSPRLDAALRVYSRNANFLGAGRVINTAGVTGIELPIATTDDVNQAVRVMASR
jgi:anti-sigma factor RsiW